MNGDNGNGFVTQREFDRTLGLLEEIRVDIKGDVAKLSTQLLATKTEITSRQDLANGRTSKNEAAVASAAEHLAAVAEQLKTVQSTVTTIERDGCKQKQQHTHMLTALASAGVVPDTGEIRLDVEPPATGWRRHAGKGAWATAGAGVAVLLPHVWSGLHWILHHLVATP